MAQGRRHKAIQSVFQGQINNLKHVKDNNNINLVKKHKTLQALSISLIEKPLQPVI